MAYIPVATDSTQPLDTVDRSTAAAEFRTLKAYVQTILAELRASAVQPASILAFGGTVANIPAGYVAVPAIATVVNRVGVYAAVHAVMAASGYPWGAGDGSTTFGIPYVPADYALTQQAGGTLGTNTVGEVLAHTHTYVQPAGAWGVTGGANPVFNNPVAGAITGGQSPAGGTANKAASTRVTWIMKL